MTPEASGSPRRTPYRLVELALWAVVGLLFVARVVPQARAALGIGSRAMPAPSVTLAMLDGGTLPLQDLRGQVVLVNFWASWCPPCRAEMPGFQKVYDAKHAAGFTVIGISTDELPLPAVPDFLREHAITYPVALATAEAVDAFGGVSVLPSSFLIDRKGRLRYTVHGMFAGVALQAAVERLLAERR